MKLKSVATLMGTYLIATLSSALSLTSAHAETNERWIKIFKQANNANATAYYLHNKSIGGSTNSPLIKVLLKHDEAPDLTKFYKYNFDCKNSQKQLLEISAIDKVRNKIIGSNKISEAISDYPKRSVINELHDMSCFVVATKLLKSQFDAVGVIYEPTATKIRENFGKTG